MPLNAQISLSILTHETSSGDLSRTLRATPANYAIALTDGTGANQANLVWSASESIAGGADWTPSGANFANFADDRGTVAFSAIKTVYIKNSGAHPAVLFGSDWPALGNGVAEIPLPAGGVLFMSRTDASGWATANSILTISTPGNQPATTIEIVLVGEGSIS